MNSIINLVNKKVLPIIVVVLLLLLGGWYFMNSRKTGTPGSSITESQGGMKSLKDLLSSGVAQKCTYSSTDESGTNEGVSYISGGKVRGDFSTTISGKVTKSHMITDGKTSYIWTDGEKDGFKMTIPDATPTSAKTDTSDSEVSTEADLDQKMDYKCSAWVVDNSYFTPPTSVTFSDFSQMINPVAPQQGDTSSQCSYCNGLSGDDKTQCLTALKCN
jgi:uncharacterized protein YxeA